MAGCQEGCNCGAGFLSFASLFRFSEPTDISDARLQRIPRNDVSNLMYHFFALVLCVRDTTHHAWWSCQLSCCLFVSSVIPPWWCCQLLCCLFVSTVILPSFHGDAASYHAVCLLVLWYFHGDTASYHAVCLLLYCDTSMVMPPARYTDGI